MVREGLARARFALGVMIVVCGSLSSVASAQTPPSAPPTAQQEQEARAHFQLGRTLYDGGRFEDAAREFQQAYDLSRRPQLLYNLFLALRDAAQVEPAIDALRRYLELVPNAQDGESLRARLASMERAQAEQRERERAAQAEADRARREAEERAQREAAARAEAEARANASVAQTPTETPSTSPESPAEQATESGTNIGPWIVVGTGGALIATGIVTAVLTAGKMSDIEAACPNDLCPPEYDLSGNRASGRVLAATTDVLLITGAAAVGGGLLWYFLTRDGESEAPAATANVGCSTTGCMASARIRF